MKDVVHLDFETASMASLEKETSVGTHNYWIHPSTRILMLAYAFGNGPVEIWCSHEGPMPDRLHAALLDPEQPLVAWHSNFERTGLREKLGIATDIRRWLDPQASARYLSLPGGLGDAGEVLALRPEFQKDKRGEDLIVLFSKPQITKKKKGQIQVQYFNTHESHPKEWEEFKEYCKQDVRAEREIARLEKLLGAYPLPEFEQSVWFFDQIVNDRGMPVDLDFVKKMYALGQRAKQEAVEKQNRLTGLENANSPIQMLAWAKAQGYDRNTLNKNTVTTQLKYHPETMTPLCIEVLEARKAASSTTYKKLAAVIRQISPDGTLKNAFIYMGSSRCGRWSSGAVQLHNMARPGTIKNEATGLEYNFEDEGVVNEARAMVHAMDYEGIRDKYGSVLLVVKNLIRTIFSVEPWSGVQ
jgi:DNA polymerase